MQLTMFCFLVFYFWLCSIPVDVAEFLRQEFFSFPLVQPLHGPTSCVQYLPHIPKNDS